jgi:GT2 family glycosyltransferase/glycosyltransferase involved in cell wall biosynthesis
VNLRRPERVVVLGMLSKMPVAGVMWQTVHYVLGLHRLGFEVYYVEAHGRTPSMLMNSADDDGALLAARCIGDVMSRIGLGDRWAYHALHSDGSVHGMSESRLRDLYRDAAAVINLHGGTEPRPEHAESGRLVYVETDPVQLQAELADGLQSTIDFLAPHRAFFTFAENLGAADCGLPVSQQFDFVPTRQPVILDLWQTGAAPGELLTTVGNWEQRWREVTLAGETYHWSKHFEFLKVRGLPLRTEQRFELALSGLGEEDAASLRAHGWGVRPGLEISLDMDPYRAYIRSSRGEFTVAKDQNVRLRSGWFSDRSATYLAAGRPVVTQDTGFGSVLPTGEGLFPFSDEDQALAAVEAIRRDPVAAGRAAAEIAREYFAHDVVLGALCSAIGLDVRRTRAARSTAAGDADSDLVLEPESKRPLRLAAATVERVLGRGVSDAVDRRTESGDAPPLRSIVVVTHDNLVVTRLCIESLLRALPPRTEVIAVDNSSADGTREYLEAVAGRRADLRLIANETNEGFARAVNAGLAASRGDTLVILNNDVITPPGWLEGLERHLGDATVGMAGPTTNQAANESRIHTAYATYGELIDFATTRPAPETPQRDTDMLTLFCAAMRREVYERIGPLDERFELGMFEDDDYCRRLHLAGLRTVCAEDVFVHHFGEASLGALVPTGEYRALFEANRQRFEEKWGTTWAPHRRREDPEYAAMIDRIRQLVAASVPEASPVGVVSRGDEALLELDGRPAFHVQRTEDGLYSGDHPGDSAAAVAAVERLRELGCTHLLIPATERWWLTHYGGLAEHLDQHATVVSDAADTCVLYALQEKPLRRRSAARRARRAAAPGATVAAATRAPAACTIIARNYLSHARVLAASYREHHPDGRFYLLVVDDLPAGVEAGEGIHTVGSDELGLPHFYEMCFKYDVTELSTAVKPSLLRVLMERYGETRVMYIDPDIRILRRMEELIDTLDSADIVLTPHLDEPIPLDGHSPSEMDILIAGAYNLGFIALTDSQTTRLFLKWWEERLRDFCRVDPASGLMVDQRWVDLVPSLFPSTAILRDATYNVAYWNLHSRHVGRRDQGFTVNGRPLTFYHFSGFSPRRSTVLSKHQTRTKLEPGTPLHDLFADYAQRHLDAGFEESSAWTYGLAEFDNGVRLDDQMRKLFLHLDPEARMRFGDPRDTASPDSYLAWATTPRAELRGLSPFLERVYRERYDVACAFPDVADRHRQAFLEWARGQGATEMGYDPRVIDPPSPTARPAAAPAPAPADSEVAAIGVNICGYLRNESGVGQLARGYVEAARALGIPHRLRDVSDLSVNRSEDDSLSAFDERHDQAVNLVCINADQHFVVLREDPGFFAGRWNVGCWSWELPEFPEEWRDRFDHYDEVWVGSSFMANAIGRVSPVPVVRIPTVVRPPQGDRDRGRERLGVTADQTVFLFMFDVHSYLERKNPVAVAEAFRRAFPRRRDVRLVVKCVNAGSDVAGVSELRAAVDRVGGTLITDYLSRSENDDLMAACDVYASLHRAEGFGLTIAEAMALGKPVIATGWSGNVDFMDVSNSFPVAYETTTLAHDVGPYRAGQTWAEPSVEHAARLMRRVVTDRDEARARGRAAARTMRERHSGEAVAPLIRDRLQVIAARRTAAPARPAPLVPARHRGNRDILEPIRRLVSENVPEGAIVAVVSKGDVELVDLPARHGWHYPQTEDGVYAGYYPATAEDAVRHLDALRRRGARYLLVPATSSWWLAYYGELRAHLDSAGRLLVQDPACSIYELQPASTSGGAPSDVLDEVRAQIAEVWASSEAKGPWIEDVANHALNAEQLAADLAGRVELVDTSVAGMQRRLDVMTREMTELRLLLTASVGMAANGHGNGHGDGHKRSYGKERTTELVGARNGRQSRGRRR